MVDGETVPVKLDAWLSHTESRRDKLTVEQLAALAALGMEWAGPAPAPEAALESPAAASAAPAKGAVREHHEECDEEVYEGGTCTCWAIKQFGAPSQWEGYGDDF
ncbi:hypothetical protein OG242_00220 [Streptomyces sp. NBC_00727]|uniref:hypothetical protein n=1 Tax=Streptomyces sp. NBC_00727 TaxID=2903675 RepID=UPI00386D2FB5